MQNLEPHVRQLAGAFPAFAEELRLAHDYLHRDAASSLVKARMVMEKVVVQLFTAEMGHAPKKPLLGDMLSDNQFTRKVERRILARINSIRDMGNLGPHGEYVEPSDATRVLEDLCLVLDWYSQRSASAGEPPTLPEPEPGKAAAPAFAAPVQAGIRAVDAALKNLAASREPLSLAQLAQVCGVAIEHGAPVYNRGGDGPAGCAHIYAHTARGLLGLVPETASQGGDPFGGLGPARAGLHGAVSDYGTVTPDNANAYAWALRGAFDLTASLAAMHHLFRQILGQPLNREVLAVVSRLALERGAELLRDKSLPGCVELLLYTARGLVLIEDRSAVLGRGSSDALVAADVTAFRRIVRAFPVTPVGREIEALAQALLDLFLRLGEVADEQATGPPAASVGNGARGVKRLPDGEAAKIADLKKKLPWLSQDLDALETLSGVDVPSALNKIRFITEKVLHRLCARSRVQWGDAEPTLERMLGPLVAAKVVPKNVAVYVQTIQTNASAGSHYQEASLSGSHLRLAQGALVEFLGWVADMP
jgi:hypothetical protein